MTDPQPSRIVAQYRTTANLQARITLHERFSVNPYGWQRWVFDQFDLPAGGLRPRTGLWAGKPLGG